MVTLGSPLERSMWLGNEAADAHCATDVPSATDLSPSGDHSLGEIGDCQHICIGFGRQTTHEVKLHLPPAVRVRRRNRANQIFLCDHFVDHLAHPLGAALWGEGKPGATAIAG